MKFDKIKRLMMSDISLIATDAGRRFIEQLEKTPPSQQREFFEQPNPLNDEEWLEAMAAHPVLIERPIVVRGNKAVVARPPEKVLALL